MLMTREETQALLQRHHEAVNQHDVAALEALYTEDATLVSPMFETVHGCRNIGRSFERLFTIFPDYTVTMRDALFIAEGDRAAEFGTVTATQRVELFGMPPTGHRIEYQTARLFTFRGNLIAYEQRIYDLGGVLERFEKIRIDRELTMASTIQQRLMARRRSSGGAFDVIGSSLPCRAIGGDFLEFVDLPDGSVWVALGDVSGKGPAAALVAAMLQGMFAMVAVETPSPEVVLSRLNTALLQRGIAPGYATLFCGRLAPNGHLHYANAGHAPPLLVNGSATRLLGSGGPMLGVFEAATFPSEHLEVPPHATIVAYSDGVTEATSADGRDYGLDRLSGVLLRAATEPLADLVEGVMTDVRAFTGSDVLTDDATIVALRRR